MTRPRKIKENASPTLPNWMISAGFIVGVVFIFSIVALSILIPNTNDKQFFIYRIVCSLGGAAFSMSFTGFVVVKFRLYKGGYIIAGGTLAVFLILYFFSPSMLSDTAVQNSSINQAISCEEIGDFARMCGELPSDGKKLPMETRRVRDELYRKLVGGANIQCDSNTKKIMRIRLLRALAHTYLYDKASENLALAKSLSFEACSERANTNDSIVCEALKGCVGFANSLQEADNEGDFNIASTNAFEEALIELREAEGILDKKNPPSCSGSADLHARLLKVISAFLERIAKPVPSRTGESWNIELLKESGQLAQKAYLKNPQTQGVATRIVIAARLLEKILNTDEETGAILKMANDICDEVNTTNSVQLIFECARLKATGYWIGVNGMTSMKLCEINSEKCRSFWPEKLRKELEQSHVNKAFVDYFEFYRKICDLLDTHVFPNNGLVSLVRSEAPPHVVEDLRIEANDYAWLKQSIEKCEKRAAGEK